MIFLDPKIDIAFKKLFGTIANKGILISFLNSILSKTDDQKIVDVELNDPTNHPETIFSKESIIDVRCTDQNKHQYIVEMQVIKEQDFAARVQYYTSLALGRQLATKENYDKVIPVIFIGIVNFNLLKSEDFFSQHLVLDTKTHKNEFPFTEIYILELPKFKKEINELSSVTEKWAYFFKNAEDCEQIPKQFEKDSTFNEAFTILSQGNWKTSDLEAYDRALDARRVAQSQLDAALQEGEIKGEIKGKAEGKAEGEFENKIKTAKKMIKEGFDSAMISKITALSIEEIERLIN